MENITVEESIDLLSGKLKYQYRALAILSLFQFSCSSYILGLPFMLSRTSFSALGSFSKLENSESLISMVEYSCLIGIAIGPLILSGYSDKFGRKRVLKLESL
jgi:hypothetical protein